MNAMSHARQTLFTGSCAIHNLARSLSQRNRLLARQRNAFRNHRHAIRAGSAMIVSDCQNARRDSR